MPIITAWAPCAAIMSIMYQQWHPLRPKAKRTCVVVGRLGVVQVKQVHHPQKPGTQQCRGKLVATRAVLNLTNKLVGPFFAKPQRSQHEHTPLPYKQRTSMSKQKPITEPKPRKCICRGIYQALPRAGSKCTTIFRPQQALLIPLLMVDHGLEFQH